MLAIGVKDQQFPLAMVDRGFGRVHQMQKPLVDGLSGDGRIEEFNFFSRSLIFVPGVGPACRPIPLGSIIAQGSGVKTARLRLDLETASAKFRPV
jgi:hypothetical protein